MLAWLFGMNAVCAVAGAWAMCRYRVHLINQLRRQLCEQYDLHHRQLSHALIEQNNRHQIQMAQATAEMGTKATEFAVQQFKLGEMSGIHHATKTARTIVLTTPGRN